MRLISPEPTTSGVLAALKLKAIVLAGRVGAARVLAACGFGSPGLGARGFGSGRLGACGLGVREFDGGEPAFRVLSAGVHAG